MSNATSVLKRRESNATGELSFNFELYYGLSSRTVRDVLDEILGDLVSHTYIHNWDDKSITTPLHTLAGVARSYLNANHLSLNTLLGLTSVEEILTIRGVNHARPAMQEAADIESHLFFSKVRDLTCRFGDRGGLVISQETVQRKEELIISSFWNWP